MDAPDRERWLALARRDMTALEARLLFALLTVDRQSPALSPEALAERVGVPFTLTVRRTLRTLVADGYVTTEREGRRVLRYRPALPAPRLPAVVVSESASVEPTLVQSEIFPEDVPVKVENNWVRRFGGLHLLLLGAEFPYRGREIKLLGKLKASWGEEDLHAMFTDYVERQTARKFTPSFIDFAQNAQRYAPKPSPTAAAPGGWVRPVEW